MGAPSSLRLSSAVTPSTGRTGRVRFLGGARDATWQHRRVKSTATTVEDYLQSLPDDRRAVVATVGDVIVANLPPGFEEGMQFGMISYHVPLERYPDTYNGQPLGIVALASQKNYMALYLMGVYGDAAQARWFKERWQSTGKRLDMGKSCVRFKSLADVPLDVIGETVARTSVPDFIASYEANRAGPS